MASRTRRSWAVAFQAAAWCHQTIPCPPHSSVQGPLSPGLLASENASLKMLHKPWDPTGPSSGLLPIHRLAGEVRVRGACGSHRCMVTRQTTKVPWKARLRLQSDSHGRGSFVLQTLAFLWGRKRKDSPSRWVGFLLTLKKQRRMFPQLYRPPLQSWMPEGIFYLRTRLSQSPQGPEPLGNWISGELKT